MLVFLHGKGVRGMLPQQLPWSAKGTPWFVIASLVCFCLSDVYIGYVSAEISHEPCAYGLGKNNKICTSEYISLACGFEGSL